MSDSDSENQDPVTEVQPAVTPEAAKSEPGTPEASRPPASESKPEVKKGSVDNMRLPSLEDVQQWQGYRVDEVSGHSVARVEGVFVDQDSGAPVWVLLKLGRFGKVVPVSIRECAAAAGRVWIPHDREVIRDAPAIDPDMPLNKEQERIVLDYYGIPEDIGRGKEIADRKDGATTSQAPA